MEEVILLDYATNVVWVYKLPRLQMTDEEIAPKIEAAQQELAAKVAELLGVDEVTITKDKEGNVAVETAMKSEEASEDVMVEVE